MGIEGSKDRLSFPSESIPVFSMSDWKSKCHTMRLKVVTQEFQVM